MKPVHVRAVLIIVQLWCLFFSSVSGGELFQRVADADCLTEKEASFYMYQLLQGLQYMHSKNIVHLDLKVKRKKNRPCSSNLSDQ